MIYTQDLIFSYENGLSFRFDNLSCDAGETLLVTGGSGKGKTTLLHLLGGLLRPSGGEIYINQTQVTTLSDAMLDRFRGSNIGLVLQQSHFVAALTVLENVVLASWLTTGKKDEDKAKVLLEKLGLQEHWHKLPSQLSMGQQQRVSIARALINEPKLLLADEPTSSLDDENAFIVAELLAALSKEYQAALIVVTHDQRLKNMFEKQLLLT